MNTSCAGTQTSAMEVARQEERLLRVMPVTCGLDDVRPTLHATELSQAAYSSYHAGRDSRDTPSARRALGVRQA
jgi:hypothetical protein